MKNPDDSSSKIFILAIVGIVVVGIAAIAYFAVQRTSVTVAEEEKTASFTAGGVEFPARPTEEQLTGVISDVEEVGLPPYQEGVADPAVGMAAPELSGTDFAGEPVEIKADGRPKVIYFLAHWCDACQREVPELQKMLDDKLLPEGLDIYSVSSLYRPGGGSSPEVWLHREKWTPPVLRDNQISSAFDLYVQGAGTPAFIYLDGENKVVYRGTGAIKREVTLGLWKQAAEGTLRAASVAPTPNAAVTPNSEATSTSVENTPPVEEETPSSDDAATEATTSSTLG